ncbi:MAG: hypothetical protein R2857_14795 [Vampirovibrionales bacterium]
MPAPLVISKGPKPQWWSPPDYWPLPLPFALSLKTFQQWPCHLKHRLSGSWGRVD